MQGYAAKTVFEALQQPTCHENMVKVGGYILGEFGNLIAGDPRSRLVVWMKIFLVFLVFENLKNTNFRF